MSTTSKRLKSYLSIGTAVGALTLGASHSFAQQAAAQDNSTAVESVVVSGARGRNEELFNVPISDTAFSAKTLETAQVRDVSDFANLTPNLSVVEAQNAGYSAITIRGITQVRNSESPVAVVVDGVEQVNSYQFTQDLFDLQSIEVLRGPQGALYGRNAEGGAILITTKQPTNTPEGHFTVGGGSGGEFNAQGVVSGAIVQDQLFGRLGVSYIDRDGYFDNFYLNKKQDPFRNLSLQGLLKWTPSDKFTADLRMNYSQTDGGALNYHFQGANLLPNGLINAANPVDFTIPGNANLVNDRFNSRDIGLDHRELADISLKLSYDLGFATLSSVTSIDHVKEIYTGDGYPYGNTNTLQLIPGTDFFDVDASATQFLDVNARSEELRLTSASNQRFRWMVGGYYLFTDRYISTTTGFNNGQGILQIQRVPAGAGTINRTLSFLGDDNHNKVAAGFVNFDYDITDALELSAGFRYDQDERTQYVSPFNTVGTPGAVNRATFSQGQPKVTATYKALPNLSFYGSWGIGFRSGEFNQNGAGAAAAAAGVLGVSDKVPQETAKTGEIGFKSMWWDDRLTINGDVYQTDVKNQQYFVFIGAIAAQVLVPIDRVQLRGGELEVTAKLTPELEAFSSIGVTDSSIQAYTVNKADVGKWAPYVPNLTFNAGLQYRTPITDGLNFVGRTDYRLLGQQYWDTENSTARDPVSLLGLSVGVETADGRYSATLRGDNLLNTRYNAEYVSGGYVEPANPLVVRGELRVNF